LARRRLRLGRGEGGQTVAMSATAASLAKNSGCHGIIQLDGYRIPVDDAGPYFMKEAGPVLSDWSRKVVLGLPLGRYQ